MLGRGPEQKQRLAVFRGRVAFMTRESVTGALAVPLDEAGVAAGFGQDGGGGDGTHLGVALDNAALGAGPVDGESVDEQVIGGGMQARDGAPHGQPGSLVDVDTVDLGGVGNANRPGHGGGLNLGRQLGAARRRERFRICQTLHWTARIENHRGGVDRPEQRAAAGFVEAGNERESLAPGGFFKLIGAAHVRQSAGPLKSYPETAL